MKYRLIVCPGINAGKFGGLFIVDTMRGERVIGGESGLHSEKPERLHGFPEPECGISPTYMKKMWGKNYIAGNLKKCHPVYAPSIHNNPMDLF